MLLGLSAGSSASLRPPVAFSQESDMLGEIVLFIGIVIRYDPKERAKVLQETL